MSFFAKKSRKVENWNWGVSRNFDADEWVIKVSGKFNRKIQFSTSSKAKSSVTIICTKIFKQGN
jgi:hypothetical protein